MRCPSVGYATSSLADKRSNAHVASHKVCFDFSVFKNVLRNLSFFFEVVLCITFLREGSLFAKLSRACVYVNGVFCTIGTV